MFKRLIACIAIVLVFAGVAASDVISPRVFRKFVHSSKSSSAAVFTLYYLRGWRWYRDTVRLRINAKTPGKYSFTLTDTRDNSVTASESGTFGLPEDKAESIDETREFKLTVGRPFFRRGITYTLEASYEPYDTDKWETFTFSDDFTVKMVTQYQTDRIVIE